MSDEAILYAIPGSHPARTGQLMLELKGIAFRRVNLMPGFHRVYVRLRGFPGDRVPAVRFADGSRAQGTRPLARALDAIRPEPRLVPDDPRVEEAERWGDDVLQQWARRMVVEAGVRDPDLLARARRRRPSRAAAAEGRPLPPPDGPAGQGRVQDDPGPAQRRPGQGGRDAGPRGRADRRPARSTASSSNCADLQIATSLALVEYRLDVRDELRRRPCAQLMARVLPGPG